ncbi:MAG: SDR family NAD(P)-dependent oxidoreductase [Anaerolineaceae bacterium]|nr:SDR family NAD(P)-dependent oxidoreductase [Anaerolineaceae bacterium]MDE0328567.1 SDR family NAD(P)-dependent oxidoreductase [Anaerolineaceae bacterium]MDE0610808.1 SDR family NAD(P)-dependent oxidoreductase [Anaerolineaceae bacterium]
MGLLDRKVAIVTGAGQGLGLAIAREFTAEGAAVAMLERNADTLADASAEIEAAGGAVLARQLDVSDYEAYAAAVAATIAWRGKIDVLVSNAAFSIQDSIFDSSLEDWRRVITVDLEAVYMGAKLVVPHMAKQRSGRIINIASIQAFAMTPGLGAYNAAKGGVVSWTKSAAIDLGEHGILVNAVAPGFMATPATFVDGRPQSEQPWFQDFYVERGKVPLRREATPEDVSGAVVFLASDYCRYMTGQLLVVDGGVTCTF